MVKCKTSTLDTTFAALSDPTRRAMLTRLGEADPAQGVTVSELAEPFDISLPAVSKHLRVLERAGLLRQERDGRVMRCRLDPRPINEAVQWIEQHRRFWSRQLDALADYLEQPGPSKS